jgi:hypothetical protein
MEGLLSATETFFPISLSRLLANESRLVGNRVFGGLIIVRVEISLLLAVHSLAIVVCILSRLLIPAEQFIERDVPHRLLLLLLLLVVVVLTVVRLLFILVKFSLDFALVARLWLLELVVLVGQHRLLHRFHKLLDV